MAFSFGPHEPPRRCYQLTAASHLAGFTVLAQNQCTVWFPNYFAQPAGRLTVSRRKSVVPYIFQAFSFESAGLKTAGVTGGRPALTFSSKSESTKELSFALPSSSQSPSWLSGHGDHSRV
ncbi:unnamed protein product [Cladocopium goreaui]|uniref:Uncharacterized protein n=1 Tax=Cladocopium goreaui TaxID=2562237 RepID=A0A9P1BXG8_9DINO|nr:unnamed protein product [Cladocopium goreaui]